VDQQDDWLALEAPKRKVRKKREVKVEPGSKLPFEPKRALSMRKRMDGSGRMWACDGEYVFFRPTRVINGVKTTVANPTTLLRHQRFLNEGQYTHVETQDDLEIYRVNESSPFARKGMFLGELKEHDVRRQVVLAACKRDWTLYTDCLEELAGRIKGQYDSGSASLVFGERLEYIGQLIAMRGGPTAGECSAGLANVRAKRGVGSGRVILLPQGKAA
jgi:hypothetical protein